MAGPRDSEEAFRFALMDEMTAINAKFRELGKAIGQLSGKISPRHSCVPPREVQAREWTCPTCERTWDRHNRGEDLEGATLQNPDAWWFIHAGGDGWSHNPHVCDVPRDTDARTWTCSCGQRWERAGELTNTVGQPIWQQACPVSPASQDA